MKALLAYPLTSAALAHALAWVVSALLLYDVRHAEGNGDSIVAQLALFSPVLLTVIPILVVLTDADHRIIWAIAMLLAVVSVISIASIGMLLFPIAGALFWTDHNLSKTQSLD